MFGPISPKVKDLTQHLNTWSKDQVLGNTIPTALNQSRISPATIWETRAWGIATGSSNAVSYRAFANPVQGPVGRGQWKLQYSLNKGSYVDALSYDPLGLASTKPVLTMPYGVINTDNSSTVDTLLSLNLNSTGTQNHLGLSFSGVTRAAWSADTSGYTIFRAAGTNPFLNFHVGNSIGNTALIAQIYTNGFYNNQSNFNAGKVTAGSPDTSVLTTLSSYGSFAVKGTLVTSSSYTLAETETMVYVDPSQANVCVGAPPACATYSTESPCNARSAVGCSWNSGSPCSAQSFSNSSSCTSQGVGCTWESVPCSPGNNTDQATCENQDDSFGGNCAWNTSICSAETSEGACVAIPSCSWTTTCSASPDESTCVGNGCSWNFTNCNDADFMSETACETGRAGCTWTGADCHAFDSTSQATCETLHTGCVWDSGGSLCNGVYDEASTCTGQYNTSCTGDTCVGNICTGNYDTGNCNGTFGAFCQGTANCGLVATETPCNAESGCAWTAGITVTLPTTANASRGNTGRVYSILHVGETGTVNIVGQSGQPIFQYTTLPLFKKGDKVLLHNQNIIFPCSLFLLQTPCQAQTGCTWLLACSSYGDQTACEGGNCSWDVENSTCVGRTSPVCNGTYSNGAHWYAHSLERGLNYVEKTAGYTVTSIDDVVNCTSGTFALTLPSAALNNGKQFTLKNTGVGVITINTTSGQTIDGFASGALTLATNDTMKVVSNNGNWLRV